MSIEVLNEIMAVPEETPVINVSMSNAIYRGPKGDKGDKGDDGFIQFEELTPEQKEELRGPQGIPGPIGPAGYTPVKGVDYFTEEDLAGLANNISVYHLNEISHGASPTAQYKQTFNALLAHCHNGDILFKDYIAYVGNGLVVGVKIDDSSLGYVYYIGIDVEDPRIRYHRFYLTKNDEGIPTIIDRVFTGMFDILPTMIYLASNQSPSGSRLNIADAINYLNINKLDNDDLIASKVLYDNSNNNIENIDTIQNAIDYLLDTALDDTKVENILIQKNYQTEEQVIALINEYASGEPLPIAEEVEF